MKILVAPLHWGLGHVTRCIPLIRVWLRQGHEVMLASDGAALDLLRAEFPQLQHVELPSYRIRYQGVSMVWNIARQLPRILYTVAAERRATEYICRQHGITHILSDNRYGCRSRRARSILLTHQLHLRVPSAGLQGVANWLLHRVLRRFDEVWVPDVAQSTNLAGVLAHPPLSEPPTRYVGLLSRMPTDVAWPAPSGDIERVAVVLSGPEPQRTLLEQLLLEQALALPQKFVFVQGKPQKKQHFFAADHVEVVSYLTSEGLAELLRQSDLVVCRSGYSSLMDLAVTGHRALLIPTPGQTEQEYLADNLAAQGTFLCQKQHEIDLEAAIDALSQPGRKWGLAPLDLGEGEDWSLEL
jgi:UDP:flavonoid glycosyltransferase YjiC (YdhE family)